MTVLDAWRIAAAAGLIWSIASPVSGFASTPSPAAAAGTPSPLPTSTPTCPPVAPPPTCASWSRRVCQGVQCAVVCFCRLLPCRGDCTGDGRVEVAELVELVGIALGTVPADRCPVLEQTPMVDDVVQAVDSALFGCAGPVTYRLLDGSRVVRSPAGGSTPLIESLTGSFTVSESDVFTPNTWFELTITALDLRAGDLAISGGDDSQGCNGTAGLGCLSSITFEFPSHVYASAAATVDGQAVGLSGGGSFEPQHRSGFPAHLVLELCGGAADPLTSCDAIRTGGEAGYVLELVADKGWFAQ